MRLRGETMYGDDPRELPVEGSDRENDDRDHRSKNDEEDSVEFNRPQLSAFRNVDEE